MRRDAWAGVLLWWSCQSPVVHSCSFLNHLNSFHGGMFKFNAKSDADLLLYLLSHFECDGHTCSLNSIYHPLTSTVKSSLFTQVHSSPLSLAARLHQCHAKHPYYINNAGLFPVRLRNVFEVHLHCRIYLYFTPFYGWIRFCYSMCVS